MADRETQRARQMSRSDLRHAVSRPDPHKARSWVGLQEATGTAAQVAREWTTGGLLQKEGMPKHVRGRTATGPSSESQLGVRKNESSPQLSPPCRRSSTSCEAREVSRACVSPLSECQGWESSQCRVCIARGGAHALTTSRAPATCAERDAACCRVSLPGRSPAPGAGHPSRAAALLNFLLAPLAPAMGDISCLSSTTCATGARVSGAASTLLAAGPIPSSAAASTSIVRPCAAARHNGSDRSSVSPALPSLLTRWPPSVLCSGTAIPCVVQSCVHCARPRWDLCGHR